MSTLKNINKPFTEIFSLLQPADISESNLDDLKVIYLHVSNVIDIILRGFQDLMECIFHSSCEQKIEADLGSFFSVIMNLVEALNWLRDNVAFSIRQQGISEY